MRILASLILLLGGLLIAAPFIIPVKRDAATEGPQAVSQAPTQQQERLRDDLRDVTPEDMTQPPDVSETTLTRLPPAAPPPEPVRPPKPVSFALPRVVSAGEIVSGETRIRLAGIEPLASDARCGAGGQDWPCGALARTALQRLIRQRTIECDPVSPADEQSEILTTRCRVGSDDIAGWLVRQGWAVPAGPAYEALLEEAKAAGRGQWGSRPD
ncbi:MAG: thermonuclease family protein [Nitratireductor sp.]|jgi:endonuclease YncB( thermonuclease family)|nr:thermonuclease family protein [Nitratireductor sp.]